MINITNIVKTKVLIEPVDQEATQSGEILPPMLYDLYWNDCMSIYTRNAGEDRAFKAGMELAWQQLKPLMQAALPYFEAGVRDTRLAQADANLVRLLAEYKEIASYE